MESETGGYWGVALTIQDFFKEKDRGHSGKMDGGSHRLLPWIEEKLQPLVTSESRDLEDSINCANLRVGSFNLGTIGTGAK